MKYLILIFIFFFNLNNSVKAADIFAELVKNNSLIKQYYHNYLKVKSDAKQELANYLPEASLVYDQYKNEYAKTSNNLKDNYNVKSYNLVLEQKIYELGALKKLAATKLTKQRHRLLLDDLIASIFIEVITLLLEIDAKDNQLKFLQVKLKLLEEIKVITLVKFENGSATKLDYLQAETEYLKLKSNILTSEKDSKILKTKFKQIVGLEYQQYDFANSNLTIPAYNVFHDNIMFDNIGLKIVQLNNQLLKLKSEIAYKNIAPDVNLYVNYDKSEGGFSYMNNSTASNSNIIYGISVNIPLFKSGGGLASIKSAKEEYIANSYLVEDYEKNLKYNIQSLWEEIAIAKELINTQEKYLEFTKKTLAAAESNYKFGKTDLLNFLEAQSLNIEGEYALIKAKNSLILSETAISNQYRL
ncbi:MAG: TolC family protein, partial [Rickettsiales bacterium]